MSKGMAEALTREHLQTNDQSKFSESPGKVTSKYKQIHDKWLITKENTSGLSPPVSDQQFHLDQIQGKASSYESAPPINFESPISKRQQ